MGTLSSFLAYRTNPADSPNIICIDWESLSRPIVYKVCPNYVPGRSYRGPAQYAIQIGQLLGPSLVENILVRGLGQQPNFIHAIGHSLGSHLVGNMARYFANSYGTRISRVTGLDPAMPYFRNWPYGMENKIDRNDAEFVDIIHSNSGDINHGCLSFPEALGDVDFYPNGGEHQPMCLEEGKMGLCDIVNKGK